MTVSPATSNELLAAIEASVDRWLQADEIDIDSQRTGGLLELVFPDDSKLIVNTQPPLHELWLAARSGGYHYRWANGAWRDTRRQRVGQALVQPGDLQPRTQRKTERRHRRAGRQPAARGGGGDHVAVPVDHVDVTGITHEELAVGPFGHRWQ